MSRHAQKGDKKRGGVLRFFRDLVIIVVAAAVISYGLKTFVVRAFYIPSGSMMQTLQVNDRILVNQLASSKKSIQRGDVVVFSDPGGWIHAQIMPNQNRFQQFLQSLGLSAEVTDEYVVKRVIGVGGDTVVCCDHNGLLTVNGVPIKEPYVYLPDGVERVSEIDFEVTVPEGKVWVLGDNRYSSKDSRYNQDQPGEGFVPVDDIVGKAFLINWPLDHISPINSHADIFAGVDPFGSDEG